MQHRFFEETEIDPLWMATNIELHYSSGAPAQSNPSSRI